MNKKCVSRFLECCWTAAKCQLLFCKKSSCSAPIASLIYWCSGHNSNITFCFVFEIFFSVFPVSYIYILRHTANIVAFYLIHKMLRVFLFWSVYRPHCMVMVNIIGDNFNLCSGTFFFHHIKSHVWMRYDVDKCVYVFLCTVSPFSIQMVRLNPVYNIIYHHLRKRISGKIHYDM